MVWYSYLFQNFPQFIVIHTVKSFGIVNESEVTQTLCDPVDSGLHQAPPSMGFFRQEYWSGLPLPSPLCYLPGAKCLCVDQNKLWKILKEIGIPDHLICLLRNLYACQEATVRTGHGKTDWFQIGKGVRQGCISSSYLFNLYAEHIMRNTGLEEAQAGIKIAGTNIEKPQICR